MLGCTTGVIKDDLDKIYEISQKIENIITYCNIHPIIVIKSRKNEIRRIDDAYSHGIGILSLDELEQIVELSQNGRPHKDIVDFIQENAIDRYHIPNSLR